MRIAILSDSHDNLPNIKKALKFIKDQGIETIIHCGDLSAPSALAKVISPNFNGKFYMANGNVGDPDLLKEVFRQYPDYKLFDKIGEVELDGKRIAFTHFPDIAKKIAQSGKYDYVFYGHSHKPWVQTLTNAELTRTNADDNADTREQIPRKSASSQRKSALLVNPGTLAGMFYKATFAILDTKTNKLELKILDKI